MASPIAVFSAALLVAAAVLQLIERRRLACWLLVLLPVSLCGAATRDLSRGITHLGAAAYQNDRKQLLFSVLILALASLAALLPQRRLLFWASWVVNALVCGALVYLVFFWHVFS